MTTRMDREGQAEFARVKREIDKAARVIAREVNDLLAKPHMHVAQDYIVEGLLERLLCDHDLLAILDRGEGLSPTGPASLKFSNALADWRDDYRGRF